MPDPRKSINLALQGGGAHGAFCWGVLDQLLADGRLSFEAISATSAGSMNAVALAYGYVTGGPEGARAKLEEFWHAASDAGHATAHLNTDAWMPFIAPFGAEYTPGYQMFDAVVRTFSPYQLNPLNINPLRDVIERVIDFDVLREATDAPRLHLSATNVRTGKIKVFTGDDVSCSAVLASACLPYIFQSVEIDGEFYWDGGYMGNPAIFPLIYHSKSRDVIVVHINPLCRPEIPKTAPEIFNRVNEISFNSSLMREMRAIAFVTRLIDEGVLHSTKYNRMLIHAIMADEEMAELSVATKLSPNWAFLCQLRDLGRTRTRAWLEAHYQDIGNASSADLDAMYL